MEYEKVLKQIEDGKKNNPLYSLTSLCWDKAEIAPSSILVYCATCGEIVTTMEARYLNPNKRERFFVIAEHLIADLEMMKHQEEHTGKCEPVHVYIAKLIDRYKIEVEVSRVLGFLTATTSKTAFVDKLGAHLYSAYCEKVRSALSKEEK
jgi:hypothetical protein